MGYSTRSFTVPQPWGEERAKFLAQSINLLFLLSLSPSLRSEEAAPAMHKIREGGEGGTADRNPTFYIHVGPATPAGSCYTYRGPSPCES